MLPFWSMSGGGLKVTGVVPVVLEVVLVRVVPVTGTPPRVGGGRPPGPVVDSRLPPVTVVPTDVWEETVPDVVEEPDDGFTLAQELRHDGFRRPILLLTSISRVTGFAYGGDADNVPVEGYLEKPVSPQVLIEKVRSLLPPAEG